MAANTSQSNGSSFLGALLGVIGAIAVFAVAVLLISGRGGDTDPSKSMRAYPDAPLAAELKEQEAEVLNSYGWVDQEKGIVRIPVDRATELVVQELNQ